MFCTNLNSFKSVCLIICIPRPANEKYSNILLRQISRDCRSSSCFLLGFNSSIPIFLPPHSGMHIIQIKHIQHNHRFFLERNGERQIVNKYIGKMFMHCRRSNTAGHVFYHPLIHPPTAFHHNISTNISSPLKHPTVDWLGLWHIVDPAGVVSIDSGFI